MKTPTELIKFYQSKKWKMTRKYIRQRDQGICQICGGVGQEVHHKIALSLRNYQTELAIDPENLTLLCKACHTALRGADNVREDVAFDKDGRMIARPKSPPRS